MSERCVYALILALLLPLSAHAQGQGPAAWSSASYLSVPTTLAISDGLTVKSAVAGGVYTGLAYSSYRMHIESGESWRRWEQIDLDMTTMSIAVVAADAWGPVVGKWGWVGLVPLGAYHALTKQRGIINPKDPMLHSGIMALTAFAGMAITEKWDTLYAAAPFLAAVFIRVVLDADGNRQVLHSSWHGSSAVAATMSLNLDTWSLDLK